MTARAVRSFLERAPLAEFERDRAALLAAHFTERERDAAAARALRSVAGDFALKRALARAAAFLGLGCAERDFEIGRGENGAPVVIAAPDGFPVAAVLVSIAHSRATACGLAVVREARDA